MDEHEQRHAAYLEQVRAKYDTEQLKELKAKGHTFPGTTSYPIEDEADLDNAIHAVGRGNADHDAIRKYIIGRAKEMGLSSKIPSDWNADGSISDAKSAAPDAEERDAKEADSEPPETAPKSWATPKRAFSSLTERPPAHTGEFQVRMDVEGGDDPIARFVGYASTTGVPYSVRDWLGEYNETILPGAFAKTLREQGNVPLLFDHGGIPVASTGSATSRLSEDKIGLRNEADLDRRDALTNSLCIQLQRKVLDKMSFSFRAVKESWNDTYDDRGVNEAALYDTSIVTYPANPTTTADLQDAMRSALGREGRSLWLADSELSVRSALPVFIERRELDSDTEDLLEKALRALVHADEVLCRSHGPQGRARTFHVVSTLLEARAGKVLSAKHHGLLQNALDALSAADKNSAKVAQQHAKAASAVSDVINAASNSAASSDGKSNSTPPANGNPIMPQDGAGPRSLPPSVIDARRQVERFKRGR